MLDEKWKTPGRIIEEDGQKKLQTKKTEQIYTYLPQILKKEKILEEKIMSEDDSLDSLYSKLVEGKQWK